MVIGGNLIQVPQSLPAHIESNPAAQSPTETFEAGRLCTLADREQIVELLRRSVSLQEDSKFGAAMSIGLGVVTAVLASGPMSPIVGIPLGVGLAAGGLFLAIKGWKEAGELNSQAAELNNKSNCFTPEEMQDIYYSIP